MPQGRVHCRYCGKDISIGNRYNHEHKACPQRPGAEDAPESPAPPPGRAQDATESTGRVKVASSARKATRRAAQPVPYPTAGEVRDNGCSTCPFHGNAAEQDLFAQLVRDGLGIVAARERLGQARRVFAGA